jgi:catechol 2,3-dioxygenase-like lactoylglutathione lyase family enzyme
MAERSMARRAQREVSVDQLAQHVDAALSAGRWAVAGSIRIRATRVPPGPRPRARGDRISWPAVRLVGINHVALEVDDVEEALAWYGRFFEFELRGRAGTAMAFIDIGDQFIAIAAGRTQPPDQARHFGLVVDDKQAVRAALQAAGVSVQASGSVDFLDPWGNHVQVVDYREIQFSKAPAVLRGMGIGALEKTPAAKQELRSKGLADD